MNLCGTMSAKKLWNCEFESCRKWPLSERVKDSLQISCILICPLKLDLAKYFVISHLLVCKKTFEMNSLLIICDLRSLTSKPVHTIFKTFSDWSQNLFRLVSKLTPTSFNTWTWLKLFCSQTCLNLFQTCINLLKLV